ncbi:MAG: VOC family protein [Allosphingosinicella sp.]
MSQHQASPILPSNDIDVTQAFYERLGFAVSGGDQAFRIMSDGRGWQIALRPAEPGWVIPDRNSHGVFLYCDDVDAIADRVRDIIIEKGAPHRKPWEPMNLPSVTPTVSWCGSAGRPESPTRRIHDPQRAGDHPSLAA